MEITLIKDFVLIKKLLKKGTKIDLTTEYAAELVAKGVASYQGRIITNYENKEVKKAIKTTKKIK